MRPPRPCLEPGCPRYAIPGKSRCEEHHQPPPRRRGEGWQTIRRKVLERDGHRCQQCGIRAEDAQARGLGSLEVHHTDQRAGGVRFAQHRMDQLITLCRRCHRPTRTERPTLREWQDAIAMRAAARRAMGEK